MTKPERTRLIFLVAALVVVAAFAFMLNRDTTAGPPMFNFDAASYSPIAVENPSLRFDLLENVHKVEYKGTHRNIFSATPPPPVLTAQQIKDMQIKSAPPIQTGPPPIPDVVVDLKFYGYVDEPRKNLRRAFFVNATGDEIYIAGVGDTLEKRLRVMRIGNDSVELEEISSSRRATVNIVPEDKTQ